MEFSKQEISTGKPLHSSTLRVPSQFLMQRLTMTFVSLPSSDKLRLVWAIQAAIFLCFNIEKDLLV